MIKRNYMLGVEFLNFLCKGLIPERNSLIKRLGKLVGKETNVGLA